MPSPLSKLPIEVIETIVSTLDRTSLCSVRLTCKELDRKTLYPFGHTSFAIIQTNLSHESLQKLQSISQTEHLKHHVQTLLIRKRYVRDESLGRGFHWHRLGEWDFPSPVITQLSPGVQMLRDILAALVNCKFFQIHSLGGGKGLYETDYVLCNDATAIILSIIAETSLPVKSFEIDFRDSGSVEANQFQCVDAKPLQMHLYQQPAFIAAWQNLEELRLGLYLESDTFDWTRDLVLRTTRFKKLALHFGFDRATSFVDSLLSSPTRIQGFRESKLGCIHVTVEMLSSLLQYCRSNSP